MKKRVLISCVLLSLVMMLSCVMAFGASAAEDTVTMTAVNGGTAIGSKVVTISTADELYLLKDYVAAGKPTAGVTFRLEANIALPNNGSATKKTYSNSPDIGTPEKPFAGIFDGNGKTISNLIIFSNSYAGVNTNGAEDLEGRGVFAYTDGATVKNVGVVAAGARYALVDVGTLIGYAKKTTVSGCFVSGNLKASSAVMKADEARNQNNIGGLIGVADECAISFCTSTVVLTGIENVGGLVGIAKNNTKIICCDSLGSVGFSTQKAAPAGTNPNNFGGVVGKLDGSVVESCVVKATVYTKDADAVGGIAGEVAGASGVRNCIVDVSKTVGAEAKYGVVAGNGSVTSQYVYSSNKDDTLAICFDKSFVIPFTKIEGEGPFTDLFAAFNQYAEGKKASYGADTLAFLKKGSASEPYQRIAYCAPCARPDGAPVCEETVCVNCARPLAAAKDHERPDVDACKEGVTCKWCGKVEVAPTEDHTLAAGAQACAEGNKCTVCQGDVKAKPHNTGIQMSNCVADVVCEDCGAVVIEALGHSWDGKLSCNSDERCVRCMAINTDKTRPDCTPDRENPTCESPVRCTGCGNLIVRDGKVLKALGHDESGADPTCGEAKVCKRCYKVLEDATWEHTVDWSQATVVREATEEHPSILRGTCSVCQQTVEKNEKYVDPDAGNTTPPADDPTDDPADDPTDDPANDPQDPSGEKDHSACEASGWKKFWTSFANFFRRLFGGTEICVCGEALPAKKS